jgi:hypothetical protein
MPNLFLLLPRVSNSWEAWFQLSAEHKPEAFGHANHEIRCANLAVAKKYQTRFRLHARHCEVRSNLYSGRSVVQGLILSYLLCTA